jgi:glucokinase
MAESVPGVPPIHALAFDIGGSHVACALVADESIAASAEAPLPDSNSLAPVLFRMTQLAQSLVCDFRSLAGVAVSFCGIVDARRNVILTSNGKYTDGGQYDLTAWAREAFGLPLRIENDARMALLGERYAGNARGCDNVVMLTLGTGIGGAAMMEGRLVRGRHAQGGCLGGHFPVSYRGRTCTCGNIGCAEAHASTWALPAIARERAGFAASLLAREPRIDFEALFRTAAPGDRFASELLADCIDVWAAAVTAMIHAYDPELVVIGGNVARAGEALLGPIREHVNRYAWTPWGKVELRPAALGGRAALLGAVPLLEELLV